MAKNTPTPGPKQLKEDQKDMIRQAWGKKRPVILSPAGSGKTLTALALFYFYKQSGHKSKMLVLAHSKGWAAYPRDNQFGFRMKTITNTREMEQYLANCAHYWENNDVIVVSTYGLQDYYAGLFPKESARTKRKVLQSNEAFVKTAKYCDFVVLDEVHRYRTVDGKDNLALAQFFQFYKGFALFLTATLFYTDLLNVYSVWRYVDPGVFPSYWQFYETYVRFIEIPMTIWKEGPNGRRYPEQIVRKEKIGYKNQRALLAKISPYLITKMNTEWTFRWHLVDYSLSQDQTDDYQRLIDGLGLRDSLYKVTTESLDGKKKILKLAASETLQNPQGIRSRPMDLKPGYYANIDGQVYVVRKVEEAEDEATFSARLPALQKYLSSVPDKIQRLNHLLADGKGALIYCQYHETVNVLAKVFKGLYPHRKVSVLTGQTTDVAKRIKGHGEDEIIFCTRAITESLNFYFRQVIIYESITSPGMLDQYVGRCSRGDANYRELDIYVFCGSMTIDMYFWERLIQSVDALDTNQFAGLLPHSKQWGWVVSETGSTKVSYRALKKLLLWQGRLGKPEEEEDRSDDVVSETQF